MHNTFARTLTVAALGLSAAATPVLAAPARQHGATHDALHMQLDARIAKVDARLAAARASGRVSVRETAAMRRRVAAVRTGAAGYAREQGFLSAGESASYNRTLAAIEAKLAG